MLGWISRLVLFLSGIIVGWFFAENDVRFEIMKLVVAMFLLVLALAAAAFWRRRGKDGNKED